MLSLALADCPFYWQRPFSKRLAYYVILWLKFLQLLPIDCQIKSKHMRITTRLCWPGPGLSAFPSFVLLSALYLIVPQFYRCYLLCSQMLSLCCLFQLPPTPTSYPLLRKSYLSFKTQIKLFLTIEFWVVLVPESKHPLVLLRKGPIRKRGNKELDPNREMRWLWLLCECSLLFHCPSSLVGHYIAYGLGLG